MGDMPQGERDLLLLSLCHVEGAVAAFSGEGSVVWGWLGPGGQHGCGRDLLGVDCSPSMCLSAFAASSGFLNST